MCAVALRQSRSRVSRVRRGSQNSIPGYIEPCDPTVRENPPQATAGRMRSRQTALALSCAWTMVKRRPIRAPQPLQVRIAGRLLFVIRIEIAPTGTTIRPPFRFGRLAEVRDAQTTGLDRQRTERCRGSMPARRDDCSDRPKLGRHSTPTCELPLNGAPIVHLDVAASPAEFSRPQDKRGPYPPPTWRPLPRRKALKSLIGSTPSTACRSARVALRIEKPPSIINAAPSQVTARLRTSPGACSSRVAVGITRDKSPRAAAESFSTSARDGTECSAVSWPLGRSESGAAVIGIDVPESNTEGALATFISRAGGIG